jgi:DNA-binding CsgD family transcriptional regulator
MSMTRSVDERDEWIDDLGAAFAGSAQFANAIVEGEPGLGKSKILDAAADAARRAGLLVLQARCSELESAYDFAVARRLLDVVRLTDPTTPEHRSDGADVTASISGLYDEVRRLSLQQPVVVVLDDLQWCDARSAAALAYLARRTIPGQILLVAATSPHTARHETGVADDLMAEPSTRVIHLHPLPPQSVSRLVHELLPDAPTSLVDACQSATGGNPFLLSCLLEELRRHPVLPSGGDTTVIDTLAPRMVARSIRRRLASVSPCWLRILQMIALLGDAADLASVAELAECEPAEVVPAVDAMVDAWLVRRDNPFRFRYPLEQSTVYAEMPPAIRAHAHSRAARALARRLAPSEDVARHLVLTEPAGDPWAIGQLEGCATELIAAGQEDLAVRCLQRVLREPLDDDARGRLLLAAAAAECTMAGATVLPYLQAAVELEADSRALAASTLELSRALPEGADRAELATLLHTIARRLDDGDHRNEEVRLRLELVAAAERPLADAAGAQVVEALLDGRREGMNHLERQALVQLAAVHTNDARRLHADAAVKLAQQLVDTDDLDVGNPTDVRLWGRAVTTLARAGHFGPAAASAQRAQAAAKAAGQEFAFLELTSALALVYQLQGSLQLAEEECRRFPSLSEESGSTDGLEGSEASQQARAILVAVLEGRGRRDEAYRLLERGPIPRTIAGLSMLELRGKLLMESGRAESGLLYLHEAAQLAQKWEIDNPAVSTSRATLAEALHHTGAVSEARELAEEQVALARSFGAAWALGAALRTAAAVMPSEDALALLTEAVEVLRHSGATLELAHALVELGALLVDEPDSKEAAREVLRRGADAAFRCSATPLVNRAQQLLRSTGARPRRVALTGSSALTPMERRVAELALAGHANLEIAEMLFVNNKTIEAHLSRVYRKLRIRSRRQLPSSLARPRDEGTELELTGSSNGA